MAIENYEFKPTGTPIAGLIAMRSAEQILKKYCFEFEARDVIVQHQLGSDSGKTIPYASTRFYVRIKQLDGDYLDVHKEFDKGFSIKSLDEQAS